MPTGRQITVVEPGPTPSAGAVGARARSNHGRLAQTSGTRLLPGMLAAAGIAAVSTVLGGIAPVVGAPVFAILIGIVISSVRPAGDRLQPGLTFTSKRILQGSIMVLGLGLSLRQVLATGEASLPVLLGTLLIALLVAWLVGRALGLRRDLNTLIGVGTAICGASAIAAADAVIDADDADVSYAVATIFTFNVVAVLAYPSLGHALGLSQHSFGLWAGTAINDVSSVVAASTIYGHAAASYGVVVKLTRTLAIIPICMGLAAWRNRRAARNRGQAADSARSVSADQADTAALAAPSRLRAGRAMPMFILGFVAAVTLNTLGLVPARFHAGLSDAATWMITAALAAIGLSTKLTHIRRAGPRPMILGGVLWATVGVASLLLQLATRSI
ncbi:MAG: YeiH family protein [Acidimicrobiales bacterium]